MLRFGNGSGIGAEMPSLFYFEHHANSRNDVKLIQLDDICGQHTGYALYFQTLEIMLEMDGHVIPESLIGSVARMLFVSTDKYQRFLTASVQVGLFELTDGNYSSPRFLEWAERKDRVRCQNSEKGKLGGRPKKQENPQDSKDTHSAPDNSVNASFDAVESKSETKTPQPKRIDHSRDVDEVFTYWNQKQIIIHREVNPDMRIAIVKAVAKYGVDGVRKAIDCYWNTLHDPNAFFSYKWTLLEFLKRGNGIPIFYEKAVNIVTTETVKSEAVKKADDEQKRIIDENRKLIAELNAHDWREFENLESLLRHFRSFPDQESQEVYKQTMPIRLQQIVTAPACGAIRVMREGIPETLKSEYEEIRNDV